MSELPIEVVQEDNRLESQVNESSSRLAEHRWHWTLDETNLGRVSISEYARAIARAQSTISAMVNGYDQFRLSPRGDRTLHDHIQRAKMGGETEAATDAVAGARGLSFKHTSDSRSTEVRRVREIARDRAEKRGTTVEEEATAVAEWIVKAEKAGQQIAADRKERLGFRFIEMEGRLSKIKRELTEAVRLAQDIGWGEEEIGLLQHDLANIKSLLHLVDLALVGTVDIDWDAELEKITEATA